MKLHICYFLTLFLILIYKSFTSASLFCVCVGGVLYLVFLRGYTPGTALRNHSWWLLKDHVECWGSNLVGISLVVFFCDFLSHYVTTWCLIPSYFLDIVLDILKSLIPINVVLSMIYIICSVLFKHNIMQCFV